MLTLRSIEEIGSLTPTLDWMITLSAVFCYLLTYLFLGLINIANEKVQNLLIPDYAIRYRIIQNTNKKSQAARIDSLGNMCQNQGTYVSY